MELDHVLSQTSSKIFVRMTGPQGLNFLKDPVSRPDHTRPKVPSKNPQKKTKLKPGPKAPFEIKNWMTLVSIPELEITVLSGTFRIADLEYTAKPKSDYRLISGH